MWVQLATKFAYQFRPQHATCLSTFILAYRESVAIFIYKAKTLKNKLFVPRLFVTADAIYYWHSEVITETGTLAHIFCFQSKNLRSLIDKIQSLTVTRC